MAVDKNAPGTAGTLGGTLEAGVASLFDQSRESGQLSSERRKEYGMRHSVRLGRVAGIDIGAHWSALIFAGLLAYLLSVVVLPGRAPNQTAIAYVVMATIIAGFFLAGLLAHELAHALVARRFHVRARRITLWLLGGVSELDRESPTPRAELLIALAGPVVSLLLGGVAAVATVLAASFGASLLIVVGLSWLMAVNIALGIFNLLPGAPLDGGRVVRAIVWWLRGDRDRAQIAADRAGVALGVILAGIGVVVIFGANLSGLWLILLGWFLVGTAHAEATAARLSQALRGLAVRDIMVADAVRGFEYQTIKTFVADTAARHPHHRYPVVDLDGRLVGMVTLAHLSRIAAPRRAELQLRAVTTPVDQEPVGPDDEASAAARQLSPANPLLGVTEQGRLVGVVAMRDINHAIELSDLGHTDQGTGARAR